MHRVSQLLLAVLSGPQRAVAETIEVVDGAPDRAKSTGNVSTLMENPTSPTTLPAEPQCREEPASSERFRRRLTSSTPPASRIKGDTISISTSTCNLAEGMVVVDLRSPAPLTQP
jgi:hypothetical protein